MEYRGSEGLEKIHQDYGDVHELCKRLKTSPNQGKFEFIFRPNVVNFVNFFALQVYQTRMTSNDGAQCSELMLFLLKKRKVFYN